MFQAGWIELSHDGVAGCGYFGGFGGGDGDDDGTGGDGTAGEDEKDEGDVLLLLSGRCGGEMIERDASWD